MASLALETLLKNRMVALNVSNDFVASLSGMSPARLSRVFRGCEVLERERLLKLDRLVGDLERLVKIVEPIPLALTNPARVEPLLETLRSQPEKLRAIAATFKENESETNQQ